MDLEHARGRLTEATTPPPASPASSSTPSTDQVDNMTFDAIRELVQDALDGAAAAAMGMPDGMGSCSCWIRDLTDTWVVYELSGPGVSEDSEGLWRATYTLDPVAQQVTLAPNPEKVQVAYQASESLDHLEGRVLESTKVAGDGGRVFRVQIIEHGTSSNGRRYPMSVLREAAPLYEGARAYDHHRTAQELATSTIEGLVGHYRNVQVNMHGLEADLHLFPSAIHTAEVLDASLVAQEAGLKPLAGISHDVLADYRVLSGPSPSGRIQEATKIVRVLSADIVADPAAGGKATRMVAGGAGDLETKETPGMDLKQLLALLRDADAAGRAALLSEHAELITEWGLDSDAVSRILEPVATPAAPAPSASSSTAEGEPEPATVGAGEVTESTRFDTTGLFGRRLIRDAMAEANLPQAARLVESISTRLGERFTEAELQREVESAQAVIAGLEREGLTPSVPSVQVTQDHVDKFGEKLDLFFQGKFSESGLHSFRGAYAAFTGRNPYGLDMEDFNREVLRESLGDAYYDSARRLTESATTATWSKTLGDSITRRLVAEYQEPALQDWRQICSSVVPYNDFRTQRIDRVGGYGTLPTVAEGAPYQPLATPTDEEATGALSKRGGTEDLTLETIANDDVRWISRIPVRLGLAAARTLHDAVFGLLSANATCSYDSTALFHANHANTTALALSYSNYVTLRANMRRQAGFGDTSNLLDLTPSILIVPPELEGIADQLVRGDYAPPATTPGATNVPNLARGTTLIVKAFLADTNDWFLTADPNMVPTIEAGFYQGRENPELFSQSDQGVGSMFNADKFTYKIRHIWALVILDHRGFQRGTQ